MNRQISLFSAGCLAIAGVSLAGAVAPVGHAVAQVAEPGPPAIPAPPVVPAPPAIPVTPLEAERLEATRDEAVVPEGQPEQISDWALAGVVWSDAHLVRKLAQAAAEEADSSQYREKMALLVNDCNELINSLETFGWRRIAVEKAERTVAAAAAAAAPEVVVTEDTERVPLDAAEAAAALDNPLRGGGLNAEVTTAARPFTFRRYRVADYIDDVPLDPDTTAESVEEGVEEAIAAAPDKIDAGFDALERSGADPRRQAQTRSATLPHSGDSIYDLEDLHPNATYPDRPDAVAVGPARVTRLRPVTEPLAPVVPPSVPTEELLDEVVANPPVGAVTTIDITRYTDRVDRFRQDADWVKFRLAANQQRWQLLESRGDDESAPALADHLDAALIQLQADAATALAASKDSQLAEVLRDIVE